MAIMFLLTLCACGTEGNLSLCTVCSLVSLWCRVFWRSAGGRN